MPDDVKVWLALATAGLALAGTIFSTIAGYRNQRRLESFKASLGKEQEAEKVFLRYRDPLMHAAYDLQSRIYNILEQRFLPVYYAEGTAREQEYAVENTVFLVAQFLGWTELIRQEIQFLVPGEEHETRRLRELQDAIYSRFQTDDFGPGFRLFAGEQRGVGELMIETTAAGRRCIGFAAFAWGRNAAIDYWLDPLRQDVRAAAADLTESGPRLIAIQNSLIDLLRLLDPEGVRFPLGKRTKVE